MGSDIGSLLPRKNIYLEFLRGQTVAVDALNTLHQFLSIIRFADGRLLADSRGQPTSHISGLFYRTVNLLEHGITCIYVFDGEPPKLKARALELRRQTKKRFEAEWKEALAAGDYDRAFKKSVMTARITDQILRESHHLLSLLGVPWHDAPSEGEAQAAAMAKDDVCYAAASQDYDSVLYGAPRLVRNLTISGKKYYPSQSRTESLIPQLILLEEVLASSGLTQEQLIDVAVLVGTDYNEGIKGIGPKRALQLVKKHGNAEGVLESLKVTVDFDLREVRELYLRPPLARSYHFEWGEPDYESLENLMLERGFSLERVERGLVRLQKAYREQTKETLAEWI